MLPPSASVRVSMVGQLDPALQPYAESRKIPGGRIVWRGRLTDDELAAEYRRAAGFIWPSLHEGFGIPPLEAQSLGVPVIASDIPINREVLGDSALYFPPTDPAALASAMSELATDSLLRSSLSARGRVNARKFTWDATAAGWDALIRRDHG
jgi:glycosyltransferase involved in cell wall biosynthesis